MEEFQPTYGKVGFIGWGWYITGDTSKGVPIYKKNVPLVRVRLHGGLTQRLRLIIFKPVSPRISKQMSD
jgi:hypothetical protein